MKICKVKNCNRVHKAMGYCPKHYSLYKLTGNPLPQIGSGNYKRTSPNQGFKKGCTNNFRAKGKDHPNWKGGITPETALRVRHPEWKKLRKKVYERDNWSCQACGKHCRSSIQCHHIVPFAVSNDNSMDNLKTLCKSCHIKKEHEFKYIL